MVARSASSWRQGSRCGEETQDEAPHDGNRSVATPAATDWVWAPLRVTGARFPFGPRMGHTPSGMLVGDARLDPTAASPEPDGSASEPGAGPGRRGRGRRRGGPGPRCRRRPIGRLPGVAAVRAGGRTAPGGPGGRPGRAVRRRRAPTGPAAPNGFGPLRRGRRPGGRGHRAVEPGHLGGLPHPGAGLRRPAPGPGRGAPCWSAASSCPTPAACSCPGSNLTNLIVLGHLHLSGGSSSPTWPSPGRRGAGHRGGHRRRPSGAPSRPSAPTPEAPVRSRRGDTGDPAGVGLGALAVVPSTVLVVALRSTRPCRWPASACVVIAVRLVARRQRLDDVLDVLGAPGTGRPVRDRHGPRHAGPGLVRSGHPALPPRRRGHRRGGRGFHGGGQQPAGGGAAGVAGAAPPLRPAGRASTSAPTSSSPGRWPGSCGGGRPGRPARIPRCAVP